MNRFLLACLLAATLTGAETPLNKAAVDAFNKAFSSEDFQAKRAAIRTMQDRASGPDREVIPLLIGKLGDRQGTDLLVQALKSRGGSGTPNSQDPAEWQAWLATKQPVWEAAAKKAAEDAAKKAATAAMAANQGGETAPAAPPGERRTPALPDDLGTADRIIFRDGSSLVCYILARRLDTEGNLSSIRVIHPGGGEETLKADIISRIEEDVR